jgi:ribosomal-protein-alanine N-acetyltransferase
MTTLETERLRLRRFTLDDLADYAEIRARPEVARWLPRKEAEDESWPALALRLVGHFDDCWRTQGYGPWAAVDRASGRLLGHLGIRWLPEFEGAELLWALEPSVWGRGYATEGAVAARDFAFERLGLERLIAIALPDNAASRRVMEKAGFAFERTATYKGLEVALHGLDRSGWDGLERGASYRTVEGSPGLL